MTDDCVLRRVREKLLLTIFLRAAGVQCTPKLFKQAAAVKGAPNALGSRRAARDDSVSITATNHRQQHQDTLDSRVVVVDVVGSYTRLVATRLRFHCYPSSAVPAFIVP